MNTFYQAVCHNCTGKIGSRDHWKSRPHTQRSHAAIKARTHNRLQHDGSDVAGVREFESDTVGGLPRDEPEVTA